jgi:2-oxopent-4-enoate/cis-2-oxohex-4-enoate hydratase
MGFSEEKIRHYGDELYTALRERKTVLPLTSRESDITIDDAYHISLRMVGRRLDDGEKIIGKKIGVTSRPVQTMLGVHQPDFGFLTDRMQSANGGEMPISRELIQPRAEGEIAFRLKKDLVGPGVTPADVLAATDSVMACFEIVDSRIQDWKIKIQDTVADNASCGLFIVSDQPVDPRKVDLVTCGMVVWKNEQIISTGAGAAVQGSPLNSVAWLANTLGEFNIPFKAGEIILSGSLVPLEPVKAGDVMRLAIGGIGTSSVRFV